MAVGNTPSVLRETCGRIDTGEEIEAVTLDSGRGVSATVLSFGATLQRLIIPDRLGRLVEAMDKTGTSFVSVTQSFNTMKRPGFSGGSLM